MRSFLYSSLYLITFTAPLWAKTTFVLIHGGGPEWIVSMKPLAKKLRAKGVATDRIRFLHYDYRGTMDEINTQLAPQWHNALAPDRENVVITHSLGDFVGLRSLLEQNLQTSVQHFVALGGVANGQNESLGNCRSGVLCPPYLMALTPYQSAYIQSIWSAVADRLTGLSHCAIYSLADRNVATPHNSSVFPHSRVAELNHISHMGLLRADAVLESLETTCGVNVE